MPDQKKQPATDLLPHVYAELRRLAGSLWVRLQPGQTLQPTALVHEAYMRLVQDNDPGWEGRRHFFGAAARAMRDILVDQARRKAALKHGGASVRVELGDSMAMIAPPSDDLLALDEAIQKLQATKPEFSEIVMLRYYAGMTFEETADVVGSSVRTVKRQWRFARAWLARELGDASPDDDAPAAEEAR